MMNEHAEEIFNFIARASKIHDEIYRLRSDIRAFISHTDYVLPTICKDDLNFAEDVPLCNAQHSMAEAIVNLCSAMRIYKEEPDKEET